MIAPHPVTSIDRTGMDRRHFLELGALSAAAVPLGCLGSSPTDGTPPATGGYLSVSWKAPTQSLDPGEHPLGFGGFRDGFVRIPEGYRPDQPAPLALLLHGAGRDAHEWMGGFPLFDELGLVALGVDSRNTSWDLRFGGFGPDVAFIGQALEWTFDRCNADPERLGIAGFSDGASYALSLGLTNGDLFSHVLGFSPGFMLTDGRRGMPPIFLAHGVDDPVLPVGFTRHLADELREDGYDVRYEEFDGDHTLPYAIGEIGFGWFAALNPPEARAPDPGAPPAARAPRTPS